MENEMQFSIYKLSKELIIKRNKNINEGINTNDMLEILLDNINNGIRKKDDSQIFEYKGYKGIFLKKKRNPEWECLIGEMMGLNKDESREQIVNESSSFIMFRVVNDEIYATTGGTGSCYLDKIKEKGYGKDLVPKLTEKSDVVIKGITEDNISGNDIATRRTKKNTSSISQEIESTKIPRELSLTVEGNFLEQFGLEIEENKKIGIDNGDSIRIKKKITLDELTMVLEKLNDIEKQKDNYQLGYLVPIKNRYSKKEIDTEMYTSLLQEKRFAEIIPETSDEYLYNTTKYYIEYEGYDIEQESPIVIEDMWKLANKVFERGTSITSIKNLITKGSIKAVDEKLYLTLDKTIYDCLRCSLEYDGKTFYLLNGQWYMYEVNKYQIIKENYLEMYNKNTENLNYFRIIDRFNLIKPGEKNEDSYNKSFKGDNDIIVTHPKLLKKIEICDLIFWDDERLYLMCNKSKMNGTGVRDLEGQIATSSSIIRGILDNDKDLLKQYYNSLENYQKQKITEKDFCNLFNKRVTYVGGFSDNFKKETTSVYCQAILSELSKKLNTLEMDLLLLNYKEETK